VEVIALSAIGVAVAGMLMFFLRPDLAVRQIDPANPRPISHLRLAWLGLALVFASNAAWPVASFIGASRLPAALVQGVLIVAGGALVIRSNRISRRLMRERQAAELEALGVRQPR